MEHTNPFDKQKIIDKVNSMCAWDQNPVIEGIGKKGHISLFDLLGVWRKEPLLGEIVLALSNRVLNYRGIYSVVYGNDGFEPSKMDEIREGIARLWDLNILEGSYEATWVAKRLSMELSAMLTTSVLLFYEIFVCGEERLFQEGVRIQGRVSDLLGDLFMGTRNVPFASTNGAKVYVPSIRVDILKLFQDCPQRSTAEICEAFGLNPPEGRYVDPRFEFLTGMIKEMDRKKFIHRVRLKFSERVKVGGSIWEITSRGYDALQMLSVLLSDPLVTLGHKYDSSPWWLMDEQKSENTLNRRLTSTIAVIRENRTFIKDTLDSFES